MKRIKYIIQKEFLQLKRDKQILSMIFVMPILQLLILANAATFEIKNVNIAVIDHDMSTYSHQLISKIQGSKFFNIKAHFFSERNANNSILKGETDAVIEIPNKFGTDLQSKGISNIFIIIYIFYMN